MEPMMDGKLIVKKHSTQHYRTVFNQKTGFFVRKEDEGYAEPTWSSDGPELIDLSITSYCKKMCSFCYRGANDVSYKHLGIKDITSVVEQAADCGTLQIALGGGNPNEHPQFSEILKLIREHDIVPSYTTNGNGLSDGILKTTADYCGAIAVSLYPPYSLTFYEKLIFRIKSFNIKVNVHAILHKGNIGLWTNWLEKPPRFLEMINAIIFLNYKPIGKDANKLSIDYIDDIGKLQEFFLAANRCKSVKVGFDSCSISGIVKWMDVPDILIEACEAARFSTFIREDMKMFPCSFMSETDCYGDLRKQSLLDIWKNNQYFINFRNKEIPNRCLQCSHKKNCMGGCKFIEEINFCKV